MVGVAWSDLPRGRGELKGSLSVGGESSVVVAVTVERNESVLDQGGEWEGGKKWMTQDKIDGLVRIFMGEVKQV